jgi:uncharacterized protein
MTIESIALICLAIFLVAFLYSSVGHAGASGYIAVMTLFGLSQTTIKPAALVLNILVASLTAWQFWRAGYFSWPLFWPLIILSAPFAFLGGYLNLPTHLFKILIGGVLLFSALRFLAPIKEADDDSIKPPTRPVSIAAGAGIGLLSGLTGTGGGIFLTPLMLLMRWAQTKTVSAISALFILVNSISGLMGNLTSTRRLPLFAAPMIGAALIGGAAGSYLGSRRFSPTLIKRLLSIVLIIAGLKLIFA